MDMAAWKFYGRKDRFSALARCRTVDDLKSFPLVEIDPGAGPPLLAATHEKSYAMVSNVATVKALVLAGLGIGDLPAFMLNKNESAQLVVGRVAHDPDCNLYLVCAPNWNGPSEAKLERRILKAARLQLG